MTTVSLSPPSLAADRAAARAVADFQTETAEILSSDLSPTSRLTLHVLAAMMAVGILLAGILPIDRVVTARGRVTSVEPHIVVQPLETSIVRHIAVREGQIVRAGDILARLDPTFSGADVAMLGQRIATLEAEIARLDAELRDAPYRPSSDDPIETLQGRLWEARAAQLRALDLGFEEKIAAARATRERADREFAYYNERLTLIREVETMRTTLQERQSGSRLNTILASDQRVEIERNVEVQRLTALQSAHQIESLRAERETARRRWAADVAEQLVERRRLLAAAREEATKAGKRRELIDLRAVRDAIVLQVGDISIGSVVESAKKLFVMVPLEGGLQVEVELDAHDQGYLEVGQPVELKYEAWPYSRHGTGKGVVRSISADAFRRQSAQGGSGPAVYVAHVDIRETALRGVPADFRLVPGMPLTADVAVGSRTLLGYLLDKVIPLTSEGLREP
ncbi:MAG: HlyD family type I secretion periplasmic adaptor subunit [Siculibacillus sp.]|nr:HlyD family type I secretion periplasmic adaptor subunit [Siculibacillus sp.]